MTPHNIQLMKYYTQHTDAVDAAYWTHINDTWGNHPEEQYQAIVCSTLYFWNFVDKLMNKG